MKAKHLRKALEHFAEEGASQVFKPLIGADWIVGVVGPLQFEVLAARIDAEYDIKARFEGCGYDAARWIDADDPLVLKAFLDANRSNVAEDHDGALVFLARNPWALNRAQEDHPKIRFLKTREQNRPVTAAATLTIILETDSSAGQIAERDHVIKPGRRRAGGQESGDQRGHR